MKTDEAINKASYKTNDEGAERIAPVFTATCTAIEIHVLKSYTFLEVLEDTFFLHEFLVVCGLIYRSYNVGKGTDIIYGNKRLLHSTL